MCFYRYGLTCRINAAKELQTSMLKRLKKDLVPRVELERDLHGEGYVKAEGYLIAKTLKELGWLLSVRNGVEVRWYPPRASWLTKPSASRTTTLGKKPVGDGEKP